MIVRLWHGWTSKDNADAYQKLLESEIVPGILDRRVEGLDGIDVLRRDPSETEDEVEFITVMRFADWDSVARFAGGTPTASVVPDAARRLLGRFDAHSQHYDLVASRSGT